jgi:glycerol-3-phosphate dehydrogenase subunit C
VSEYTSELVEAVRGSLDHCIKCTICETYCPVSNVTTLFPGPKYVGPQGERFRGAGESPDQSLDYCSGCGVCSRVCPHGVKIAEINTRARAELKQRTGVRLRDRIIARPPLQGRLGTPVAPVANWAMANRTMRAVIERTIGVHRRAPVPRFAGRTFQRWARRHEPPASATKTVVYFHGCSANWFEPRLGEMTVAVLEHNGFRVVVPRGQSCCGLPLQSNGLFEPARRYVRKLVARLAPEAGRGVPIVASSTSCGLMLKREAHEILGIDDPDLHVVSGQMYDICEFLLDLHHRGELEPRLGHLRARALYHPPCQLMAHGVGTPALDLLDLVPGLEVELSRGGCCGTAGTYGTKVEKYQIAMDVGRPLFQQVADARADFVVCDSETCRWHLAKSTGLPVYHPVQVLDRAYSLA